jgi:hypothetical protein
LNDRLLGLTRSDVKVEELCEFAFRVTFDPVSAKRVIDHVADNPVGCKELCRCRDLRLIDSSLSVDVNDLVVNFRDIELVEPADDLDLVLPVFRGDVSDQVGEDAVLMEDVIGEEEFRVAPHGFEHPRKDVVEGIALREEEVTVEILVTVLREKGANLFRGKAREVKVEGLAQEFGFEVAIGIREDTDVRGEVVIDLHEAEGDEAVEPRVGDLIDDLVETMLRDMKGEFIALYSFLSREEAPTDARRIRRIRGLLGEAEEEGTLGDLLEEFLARPDSELLNRILIHDRVLSYLRLARMLWKRS